MTTRRIGIAALTFTAALAAGSASAQYGGSQPYGGNPSYGSNNPQTACADAARSLVHQETRWNDRGRERGMTSGTLYWQAVDGTQGTCLVDRNGRVYQVRVDRWGGDVSVWPGTGPGEQTHLVRCESDRDRRRECSIPRGSRVRLFDQLSSTPCVQNRNWGYYRDELWVDDGCRGIFEVSW